MAFSTNGASNGTIMGNADALKGDSASLNTITGSVPINQHVTSGSLMGPGVLGKKHGHDDEEQGKLFVGGLRYILYSSAQINTLIWIIPSKYIPAR